jgi:hypothetical protein
MAKEEVKAAWDNFEADIQGLAGELRRHYHDGDATQTADLSGSLDQLRQAAESVFKSLETATRDPDVRSRTKQTARSFGSALGETFRELSDEIEKALKKPASTK